MYLEDSYQMLSKVADPKAFTAVHEDLSNYNILFSIKMNNDEPNIINGFFKLYKNCTVTSSYEQGNTTEAVKIALIHDENGEYSEEPDEDLKLYGIFVRKDVPLWIQEGIMEARMCFSYLFGDYDNIAIVNVACEEHFDLWLGENPVLQEFTNDILFASIDKEQLTMSCETIDRGWTVDDDVLIPFRIVAISKDSIEVVPQDHLARLLPFRYRAPMSEFKKNVISGGITLFSVTTN